MNKSFDIAPPSSKTGKTPCKMDKLLCKAGSGVVSWADDLYDGQITNKAGSRFVTWDNRPVTWADELYFKEIT